MRSIFLGPCTVAWRASRSVSVHKWNQFTDFFTFLYSCRPLSVKEHDEILQDGLFTITIQIQTGSVMYDCLSWTKLS